MPMGSLGCAGMLPARRMEWGDLLATADCHAPSWALVLSHRPVGVRSTNICHNTLLDFHQNPPDMLCHCGVQRILVDGICPHGSGHRIIVGVLLLLVFLDWRFGKTFTFYASGHGFDSQSTRPVSSVVLTLEEHSKKEIVPSHCTLDSF